jgi:adenylate cyclase
VYSSKASGINLTSRLEGLNKHYGTRLIASETIYAAAKDSFEFQLLDRVAVKGRMEGIVIYELVGERTDGKPRPEFLDRYEAAFTSYHNGDFDAALRILGGQYSDPASHVLGSRCREFLSNSPKDWTGVHGFKSK